MRIVKILLPLILFIIGGAFGVFSPNFIQTNNSFYYWFIIPAFALGIYYAFALTLKYNKNEGRKVALGRIAITIFITSLSYRAIQGYIILLNCYFGKQKEQVITGQIYLTNFPQPKKIFDKNSITIILTSNQEKITLEVPDSNYSVGQIFNKSMFVGSFGILYSSN